ncbi:tryptophan biosynthesis modulator TrpM [Streptomyces sp. NPDC002550]
MTLTVTTVDRYARLARGCRPRGCRAPARRVHGRRVRYVIGDEPGQVNGRRWQRAPKGRGAVSDHATPSRGRDQPHTA